MQALDAFRGARVLVTGHCGFKGSWLVAWLDMLGAKVHGVSLGVPTTPSIFEAAKLHERVDDARFNVCEHEKLRAYVRSVRPDILFHLAAQPLVKLSYRETLDTWQSNVFGTLSVLEALRDIDHPCVALFITSDKSYDNVEWVWGYRETDRLGGPDPYSASKAGAEIAIRSYVKSFFPADGHVRVGVGRAGNVIGGGDWAADRIVPDCVRAWSANKPVELRRPRSTRPWQHVLEPLSGYISLAAALLSSNGLHGEPFNFGPSSPLSHTVADVVSLMAQAWPGASWKDVSGEVSGQYESDKLRLNSDKALHYLGWYAALNFEETVGMTVEWYKRFTRQSDADMRPFTNEQISAYTGLARERGIQWAR